MIPRTAASVNEAVNNDSGNTENSRYVSSSLLNYNNENIYFEVSVSRDANGVLMFTSSQPLPTMAAISEFLTDVQRIRMRDYGLAPYVVDRIANGGNFSLTPRQWQEILVKEIFKRYGTRPDANDNPEPVSGTILDNPAFLVTGGNLYELKPIERVKTSAALRGLRKRITAEAEKQALDIQRAAKINADAFERQAAVKLEKANKLLKDAQQAGKLNPPEWAVAHKLPMYIYSEPRDDGTYLKQWCIGIAASIRFTQVQDHWADYERTTSGAPTSRTIVHKFMHWNALPNISHINVRIWVRLDDPIKGLYNQTAIHLDGLVSGNLPHMTHHKACMTLGDPPKTITSYDELCQLKASIERCFKIIDYSSPLVRAELWSPAVRAFFTPELVNMLANENWRSSPSVAPNEQGTHNPLAESNETWSAA